MPELDEISLQIEAHLGSFLRHLSLTSTATPFQIGSFCGYQTEVDHPLGCAVAPLPNAKAEDVPAVVEFLRARGKPAFWATGMRSAQVGIVDAIQAEGLKVPDPSPGMALDLDCLIPPPVPGGFEVKKVETPNESVAAGRILERAFNLPREIGDLIASLPPDHPASASYLLSKDGIPVGTAFGLLADGILGIYNVGVIPEFRGRGCGAAITAAAIYEFRDRGVERVVLHASALGYPVYKRLGFTQHGVYRFAGFLPS